MQWVNRLAAESERGNVGVGDLRKPLWEKRDKPTMGLCKIIAEWRQIYSVVLFSQAVHSRKHITIHIVKKYFQLLFECKCHIN